VEDLLLELLGALLEIFGDVLLQIAFELAAEALGGAFGFRKRTGAVASVISPILVGAIAGFLSIWLFPHRLIAAHASIPGASLVLAPLATGYAMNFLGDRLRRFGRCTSSLATFRGGALCAFTMALIRFGLVGLDG
jgi:hypothetical protein